MIVVLRRATRGVGTESGSDRINLKLCGSHDPIATAPGPDTLAVRL